MTTKPIPAKELVADAAWLGNLNELMTPQIDWTNKEPGILFWLYPHQDAPESTKIGVRDLRTGTVKLFSKGSPWWLLKRGFPDEKQDKDGTATATALTSLLNLPARVELEIVDDGLGNMIQMLVLTDAPIKDPEMILFDLTLEIGKDDEGAPHDGTKYIECSHQTGDTANRRLIFFGSKRTPFGVSFSQGDTGTWLTGNHQEVRMKTLGAKDPTPKILYTPPKVQPPVTVSGQGQPAPTNGQSVPVGATP